MRPLKSYTLVISVLALLTSNVYAGPALVDVPERCKPLLSQFHAPTQRAYNLLIQAGDLKARILDIISPDPGEYHPEALALIDRLISTTEAAISESRKVVAVADAYADADCPTNPGSTARGAAAKYRQSLNISVDALSKFTEAKNYYLQVRYFNGIQKRMEGVLGSVTAICADGWASFSQHSQGTCSWHGGVATWRR